MENHSTIVYIWQVPGEEGRKRIQERISETDRKVAEFSSEKINIS
jgi:hypothetical protein